MKSNAIFVGMAIAISALVAACDRSDSEVAARKKLSKLEEAAARYKNDCGQFPDKAEDLRKNPGVDAWQGPYFEGTLENIKANTNESKLERAIARLMQRN